LTAADANAVIGKISVGDGEVEMLEYFAYALLALLVIGCILYVTLSPEVEEPPAPKRPDPSYSERETPPPEPDFQYA
jgi:hypothetical protein